MKSSIIIFSKAPVPGLVKTRLTQYTCLTEVESAQIARAMLKDTIKLASETIADRIQIGFFPAESNEIINEIVESVRADGYLNKNVEFFLQYGSNFDERFGSIVKEAFKTNMNSLIILGADLPFLDPQIINSALEDLAENIYKKPIIIGPSSGGGIYLVGITKDFNPNWFSKYHLFRGGIELSKFTSFCKNNEFKLITLPPYGDIDIEEDLVSLITYIEVLFASEKTKGFHFPYYTSRIIDELKLYIEEEQDQTRRRKIAKKRDD